MAAPHSNHAPEPLRGLKARVVNAARRALTAILAWPDRTFIVVLFTGTYVLVSFGLKTAYPFSVFEMYASTETTKSASRILVRDSAGTVREVTQYGRWRCHPIPSFNPAACEESGQSYYSIAYVDRERRTWIEQHPAGTGDVLSRVTLIRRIWRFPPANPVTSSDCMMGACEAAR